MLEVVDVAHRVSPKCIASNAHVSRESNDLLFVDDKLFLETPAFFRLRVLRRIIDAHRHAIQVPFVPIVGENLCMFESKQLRQVDFHVANDLTEGAVLYESDYELDHSLLHLLFVLTRDGIREDLHPRFG